MSELAETMARRLGEGPLHFAEMVDSLPDTAWRDFLRAWGVLRQAEVLTRDDDGRYVMVADGLSTIKSLHP